jgi:hypothetical protein
MHESPWLRPVLIALLITSAELALGAGDDHGDGATGTYLTGTTPGTATLDGAAIDVGLEALRRLCAGPEAGIDQEAADGASGLKPQSKIRFDLDRFDAEGLQGPPDGLRALHYELCIPDRPDAIGTVTGIDPTLEIHRGSPGRIGCGTTELLCLGHTHQRDYRAVLERLATLPFVKEIREAFFE